MMSMLELESEAARVSASAPGANPGMRMPLYPAGASCKPGYKKIWWPLRLRMVCMLELIGQLGPQNKRNTKDHF